MTEVLVETYLARLRDAAGALPPDRAAELVQQISDHIAEARAAGLAPDEAALRTLLERLGDPEEIVAAAQDAPPGGMPDPAGPPERPGAAPARPARRGIAWEVTAVLLMTLGSVIPLLGWGAGVLLLWTSRLWRTGEKLAATLLFPLGPFSIVLLGGVAFLPARTCSSSGTLSATGVATSAATTCTGFALPPYVGLTLLAAWVIVPFVVGGVLLKRANDRAALEQSR